MQNDNNMEKVAKVSDFTLKFGKHKYRKFKDVDPAYLKWALEKGVFDNDEFKWNKFIRLYIINL